MDITPETKARKTNPEPFKDAMNNCQHEFAGIYRKYVKDFYSEYFKEMPDRFLFMRPMLWSVVFRNRIIEVHVFHNEIDRCEFHNAQLETQHEVRDQFQLPPHIQKQQTQELIKRTDEPLSILQFEFGNVAPAVMLDYSDRTENPNDMPMLGRVKARELAKEQGENARKQKEERFNLFGIEEIIPIVNDEHFDYEMSEAIECYKRKLYLAATAVVGVALENILVLILKKNGLYNSKIQPYIKDYSKVLVDNELLEDRKRREIMNFNNTRNGAAHSNSGVIMATHSEEGFSIIKYLANKFY